MKEKKELFFDWCNEYNIENVKISIFDKNVTIYDSYKITKRKHMKEVIQSIKSIINDKDFIFCKRKIFSIICEWCAHNLLYELKIKRDRTESCDINDESFIRIVGYVLLSLFYIKF